MSVIGAIVWQSLVLLPIAVMAAMACVLAVWWLYPSQVSGLKVASRWALPVLRGVALTVLSVSMLKPVAIRPATATAPRSIAILLDRSASMSARETGGGPAQRVELADALGRLPKGVRTPALAALRAQLISLRGQAETSMRAQSELDYARLAGRGVESARQRFDRSTEELADASEKILRSSASVGDGGLKARMGELSQTVAARSRPNWATEMRLKIEAAVRAATDAQRELDANLYATNPAVKSVCDEVAAQSRLALAEQSLVNPATGLLPRLPAKVTVSAYSFGSDVRPVELGRGPTTSPVIVADAEQSDITGAIRQMAGAGAGAAGPDAIVVFSDGRQVGGQTTSLASLASAGVPVFAVLTAADGLRDLSFASAAIPRSVLAGQALAIDATIRGPGFKGASVEVQLSVGEQVVKTETVAISDASTAAVHFEVPVDQAGLQRIALSIKPADGEASIANNTLAQPLKVIAEKLKVAAVAASPTWDFQYVRDALSRTPWVTLVDTVLMDDAKFPLTSEQILQQDVMLLSDVGSASLDLSQWDAVHRLVTDRGGSLILIAGDAHLPAEFNEQSPLADLLPYRVGGAAPVWRAWSGEDGHFRLAPARDAQSLDFLKLDDGADQAASLWQELPAMFRYVQIGDLKPDARALLVERESGAPVLVESRAGAGRVILFGSNETWRWRQRIGEDPQERFWLQLLRYAVEDPYLINSGSIAFDLDKPQVQTGAGETLTFRAKLPATSSPPGLEIVQGDRPIRSALFNPAGNSPGRFQFQLSELPPPGEYVAKLLVPGAATTTAPVAIQIPFRVTGRIERELADLSGDEKLLRTIADSSGGELVRLADVPTLSEKLLRPREQRSETQERTLWDSPYLFAFILGCFGTEWALRKRLGLA